MGNAHDIETAFDFLDELPVSSKFLLADKGYDSDVFRDALMSVGKTAVIPGRRSRLETINYDKEMYRGRHVVENKFCDLKQFRSIAMRFDKLDVNFMGTVALACLLSWLRV